MSDSRTHTLRRKFSPSDCPHCAYDRQFGGFETGGWLQQDNNGPIVPCPVCNDDGLHPFNALNETLDAMLRAACIAVVRAAIKTDASE